MSRRDRWWVIGYVVVFVTLHDIVAAFVREVWFR